MMNTRGRQLGALAMLVAIVIGLHILGSAAGLTVAEWRIWTEQPAEAATGILRLLALALSYYLVVVLVAMAFLGDRIEGHRFEKLIPYAMFATLGLVAGVGALTAATAPGAQVAADGPSPLTLQPTNAPLTLQSAAGMAGTTPDLSVSHTHFGADSGIATAAGDTWQVRTGESFWSIAEETLEDAWGTQDLTDEEIVSYWEPLIEANKDRLVDPGNPDLILPDQELVLPTPPANPR